jgi:hypothetical protein
MSMYFLVTGRGATRGDTKRELAGALVLGTKIARTAMV